MTSKSWDPNRGEGFLWFVGSEKVKGSRVWKRRVIKKNMCSIVLNRDNRMWCIQVFFFVYLSYLLIFSVVINGGGNDWAVVFGGAKASWWYAKLLNFTVVSNLSVRLSCVRICMLCSCMSLWMSCLYCNLLSAQLCSLLLSRCWPNNGGAATNVFWSNRRG